MLRVGRRSGRIAFGPDRQFVATGLDELEAAATGEGKHRAYDLAAGVAHGGLDRSQIVGIQHQQRCTAVVGPLRLATEEAALQAAIVESRVVAAVVDE